MRLQYAMAFRERLRDIPEKVEAGYSKHSVKPVSCAGYLFSCCRIGWFARCVWMTLNIQSFIMSPKMALKST